MKRILLKIIKKYVRFLPYHNKGIICDQAKGCHRGCPCAEQSKKVLMFKLDGAEQ